MLHDLKNMARANIWQPKALEIKSLAENFKTYILTLKKELQSESNERLDNFKTIFDEDNKTASHEIFIHKNETVKLNSHWENFVQNILKVDTNLNEQFKAELMISPNTDSTNKELQNYFENSTTIGALSTLSSYENRCVIIENMFITYCHSKIPTLDGCGFGKGPDILVYQNRNYIKPGEALVITAGIAQYSFESRPNIFINGKKLELERNGSAMYTMKANNKPGFYEIPVRIEFINANGDRVTKEKYVKYEIAPN